LTVPSCGDCDDDKHRLAYNVEELVHGVLFRAFAAANGPMELILAAYPSVTGQASGRKQYTYV